MLNLLANIVSVVGHPLWTASAFAVWALYTYESPERAARLSWLVIAVVIVPVVYRTVQGVRRGTYTNFDVSNREQRQRWYGFPLLLLGAVTAGLFLSQQPLRLSGAFLCVWCLLAAAQLLNKYLKVSLHVGINAFIAVFLAFMYLPAAGWMALAGTVFIAWSRVHLKRHTWPEVGTGMALGILAGMVYGFFFGMN
jgi:hypothetical protein